MLPVLQIGPVAVQSFILALMLALWFGSFVAERECKRRNIASSHVWNLIALGVGAALISARLIFVAQNWDAYAGEWAQIIAPTPGALALDYGVAIGIIVVLAYIQWRQIPFPPFADALAPGVLVAIALIAVGQFLSGDALGTPADVPWAVSFWGERLHPVQLYDACAALIGLGIVWRFRARGEGLIFLITVAWYSAARVFIDAFRAEVLLIGNGYRLNQIIALIILLIALWWIAQQGGSNAQATEIQTDRKRAGE